MPNILGIETTGRFCSVSLFDEQGVLSELSSKEENSHSLVLHGLITSLIEQQGLTINDLDAVALSQGPGSYTGLRIGSSSAKGLCIALDIPLIAIPTHDAMLFNEQVVGLRSKYAKTICLTDARRMDVFVSVYTQGKAGSKAVSVLNLEDEDVQHELNNTPSLMIGSGAHKSQEKLSNTHYYRFDDCLGASQLWELSIEKFKAGSFADLFNFEPAYEKQFYTVPSKKKVL